MNWAHNNQSYIIDTYIMKLGENKWDKISGVLNFADFADLVSNHQMKSLKKF